MYQENYLIISYLQNFHIPEDIQIIFSECINNFSDKKFNINGLCNNIGMSYHEVYERLLNHLNLCPFKILENIRMEYVLAQLKANYITIYSIALNAGFPNLRTFRRAFKRCTGVSAKECRLKLLGDDENLTQYKSYLEKIWER